MTRHDVRRPPKTVAALAVGFCLGLLVPLGTRAQEPLRGIDGTMVLERASQRYASLEGFCADFHQTIDVTLLRQTKLSEGELCQMRPDRFEMRWSEPEGDRIVSDGSDVWVYFRSTDAGQAFRTPLEGTEGSLDWYQEFFADPGLRYQATYEGREEVAGGDAYVLSLSPRVPSPYLHARLWIDSTDHLLHRLEILEESESIRTLDLTNPRLNPSVDDSWFHFEPPPGVQVITP